MTTQSEIKAKFTEIDAQVAEAKKMFCDWVKEKEAPRHLDGVFLEEPRSGQSYNVIKGGEIKDYIWNFISGDV